jgi:uncharacterized protein
MAHPNEELARKEFAAVVAGDMESLFDFYADDYVFHYPGRSPVAGEYRGKQGFGEFLGKLSNLGVIATRELHDVIANDDHVIQLVAVRAERDGKRQQWNGVVVMHVRDGKIAETWVHIDDLHGLDEFLS